MASQCRKFQANIFNKSKCQACFRDKGQHSAEALESSRVARKVSKCGYLFISPDLDFNNLVHRTKRWQRRFFILYDDGELTYSVDESPQTLPQGEIDMNKCSDVFAAENITNHEFSIAVVVPTKTHYIKGTCSEEIKRWHDVLVMYPKSIKIKHRRTPTYTTTQIKDTKKQPPKRSNTTDFARSIETSPRLRHTSTPMTSQIKVKKKDDFERQAPEEISAAKQNEENAGDHDSPKNRPRTNSNHSMCSSTSSQRSTPEPGGPLTFRGVRSLKHKSDMKHRDGLRKSRSLQDLFSETNKEADEQSNLGFSKYLSKSRDDIVDETHKPKTLFESLMHPEATKPPLAPKERKTSAYLQLANIPKAKHIDNYVPADPASDAHKKNLPSGIFQDGNGRLRFENRPSILDLTESKPTKKGSVSNVSTPSSVESRSRKESFSDKNEENERIRRASTERIHRIFPKHSFEDKEKRDFSQNRFHRSRSLDRAAYERSRRDSESSTDSNRVGRQVNGYRSAGGHMSRQTSMPFRSAGSYISSYKIPGDTSQNMTDESKMAKSTERSRAPGLSNGTKDFGTLKQDTSYMKKGWLFKQTPPNKDWMKHWFVLSGHALKFFKDSKAEELNFLMGFIDLSCCNEVTEINTTAGSHATYAFKVKTLNGDYMLGAMTPGIRSNWMQAIQKCVETNGSSPRHMSTSSNSSTESKTDLRTRNADAVLNEDGEYMFKRPKMELRNISNPGLTSPEPRQELPEVPKSKLIREDKKIKAMYPTADPEDEHQRKSSSPPRRRTIGSEKERTTIGTISKAPVSKTRSDADGDSDPDSPVLIRRHSCDDSQDADNIYDYEEEDVGRQYLKELQDLEEDIGRLASKAKHVDSGRKSRKDQQEDITNQSHASSQQSSENKSSDRMSASSDESESTLKSFHFRNSTENLEEELDRRDGLHGRAKSPAPRAPSAKIKDKSRSKSPKPTLNQPVDEDAISPQETLHTESSVIGSTTDKDEEKKTAGPLISPCDSALIDLLETEVAVDYRKTAQDKLVESLKSQLEHTQKELVAMYDSNIDLKTQLKLVRRDHKDSMDSLEDEQSHYIDQIQALTSLLNDAKNKVDDQDKFIEELENKLDMAHDEIQETKSTLAKTIKILKDEEDANLKLKKLEKNWEQKYNEAINKLNSKEKMQEKIEMDIASELKSEKELKLTKDDRDIKLSTLENQPNAPLDVDDLQISFNEQRKDYEEKLKQAETKLETATKQSYMADSINADMMDILKEKDETIAQLEDKLNESESRIGELTKELNLEMEDNVKMEETITSTMEELTTSNKKLGNAELELMAIKTEFEKEKKDSIVYKEELLKVEDVFQMKDRVCGELVAENDKMNAESNMMRTKLEKYKSKLDEQQEQIVELKRASHGGSDLADKYSKATTELKEVKVTLQALQNMTTEDTKSEEKKSSILRDLEERLTTTELALCEGQGSSSEGTDLDPAYSKEAILSEYSTMKLKFVRATAELNELNKQIQEQQQHLHELRSICDSLQHEKNLQDAKFNNHLGILDTRLQSISKKICEVLVCDKGYVQMIPEKDRPKKVRIDLGDKESVVESHLHELEQNVHNVQSFISSQQKAAKDIEKRQMKQFELQTLVVDLETALQCNKKLLNDCGGLLTKIKDDIERENYNSASDDIDSVLGMMASGKTSDPSLKLRENSQLRVFAQKLAIDAVVMSQVSSVVETSSLPVEARKEIIEQISQAEDKLRELENVLAKSPAIGKLKPGSLDKFANLLTEKLLLHGELDSLITQLATDFHSSGVTMTTAAIADELAIRTSVEDVLSRKDKAHIDSVYPDMASKTIVQSELSFIIQLLLRNTRKSETVVDVTRHQTLSRGDSGFKDEPTSPLGVRKKQSLQTVDEQVQGEAGFRQSMGESILQGGDKNVTERITALASYLESVDSTFSTHCHDSSGGLARIITREAVFQCQMAVTKYRIKMHYDNEIQTLKNTFAEIESLAMDSVNSDQLEKITAKSQKQQEQFDCEITSSNNEIERLKSLLVESNNAVVQTAHTTKVSLENDHKARMVKTNEVHQQETRRLVEDHQKALSNEREQFSSQKNLLDAEISRLRKLTPETKKAVSCVNKSSSTSELQKEVADLQNEMENLVREKEILQNDYEDRIIQLEQKLDATNEGNQKQYHKEKTSLKARHQMEVESVKTQMKAALKAQRERETRAEVDLLQDVEMLRTMLEDERKQHKLELESLQHGLRNSQIESESHDRELNEKIQEMQLRMFRLQDDFKKEIAEQKDNHGREIMRSKHEMAQVISGSSEDITVRRKFDRELERLKDLCNKSLATTERSHHQIIREIQDMHKRELRLIRQEKEEELEEETKATQAALDAMRKAHEFDLQKEKQRFKDIVAKMFSHRDIEDMEIEYSQKEIEMQQEIKLLKEQYDMECQKTTSLQERFDDVSGSLKDSRRHVQNLMQRNEDMNMRFSNEIDRLKKRVNMDVTQFIEGQEVDPDIYELKMAAQLNEVEVQQMKEEIDVLREQLQDADEEQEEFDEKIEKLEALNKEQQTRYVQEINILKRRLEDSIRPSRTDQARQMDRVDSPARVGSPSPDDTDSKRLGRRRKNSRSYDLRRSRSTPGIPVAMIPHLQSLHYKDDIDKNISRTSFDQSLDQ